MKIQTTTVSYPSSLQTTQQPKTDGDAQRRILIGSFVGAAVLLVMILLFAIYCYNKRHPIQSPIRYPRQRPEISGPPSVYVYENKGLQYNDQDSTDSAHDISIKLHIQWDDMYSNTESENFKTLRDQIVESMQDLYKHYCEFRGAILLKLRKGSVIADIRLKFSKLAVEPLNIIKSAVAVGTCSSFEVEKDYFYEQERHSRQSRSDKTESGYGSQVFEHISFVEKSQELKVNTSPENSPKSTSELTSNVDRVSPVPGLVHRKCDSSKKDMDGWSSSHRVKSKKKNVANMDDQVGRQFVARFDFQPQDYRELALHQGELVRITCIDAGGWVKVVNASGEEGWVPRNFIVEIDPEDYVNRKKAVESIIFLDQMIESAEVPDEADDATNPDDMIVEEPECTSIDVGCYENVPNDDIYSEDTLNGLFVAIFPFDPSDEKELKLELGDLIDVSRTSETGWWKGCSIRTNNMGWFPSTYVKPKSAEINFQSFFGDLSHVEESVSDSELHSSKRTPIVNGYYSDNEENKVKDKFRLRGSASVNSMSFDDDDVEEPDGCKKDVIASSDALQSSGSFSNTQAHVLPRRSASAERLIYQNSIGNVMSVNPADPPAKPVPPKPRKQHMKQTYQKLAAKGQLCTTNELMSRSLESLRVRSKSASRRFSEEIYSADDSNRKMNLRPIEKDRPLSFQGAPRFVQLANRYASNMKASWSLPSLNGDQVKLSPDDDRPYLEPIPRKNKSTSVELLDSKIRSGDVTTDEYIELNPSVVSETSNNKEGSDAVDSLSKDKTVSLIVSNENGVFTPKIDETIKKSKEPPPKPERESLKYGFTVRLAANNDTKKQKETSSSGSSPESDAHLHTCSSRDECDCGNKEIKSSDDVFTSLKPSTRLRNPNTRNFSSFESINEENESTSRKDSPEENRHDNDNVDPSQNEQVGTCVPACVPTCVPNEYATPTFLQRQSAVDIRLKPEPRYSNIVIPRDPSHTKNKHKLYFRKINSFGEEESEDDTASRTSSTLSLSSFSSSNASRSTTSSKHEQMNLRRAVMDVEGETKGHLSFKIGAMLYELRPRNKDGLCYGLLEDSTEGWYPSTSVEIFQISFQV